MDPIFRVRGHVHKETRLTAHAHLTARPVGCMVNAYLHEASMRITRPLPWLLFIAGIVGAPAGAQKPLPAWQQAESAIRADYAKREADAKILEIVQGERAVFPFWTAYEANVSVERSGRRRDKERVGVAYWLVKGSWELDGVALLGRRDLADIAPPPQDEAQKLLNAAWAADKCEGYDITAVKLEGGDPRFQRETVSDAARAKRSFVYAVDVQATGNGKSRMSERGTRYSNRTQNLLTWNAESKSWSVDPRQVRCTGWVKEAGASQPAPVPTAIAGIASSDPPADADVIKVFTQAWSVLRPDFTVSSITVKSKDPHQYQDRRWINYKLSIIATGTDQGSKSMAGKKYLCEPDDFSSVLKWDAEAKQWKVDEKMVKNFNESSCSAK
jgi:hypothetical protein